MKLKQFYISLLLLLFTQVIKAQYIAVDENYTAQQLVENVLLNNPCASVTNISVSGGNFASGEKSFGYFDGNNSGFPFENGIILSTGKINNAPGPNAFISDDGGGMGWNGDSDLNQALNISNSINATILEFDFIPLGNHISFDYIFASEEYHGTATCTYSDGFAFLLKEVGTSTYQNLALIPNTNIPVKVTTVHPNIPGGCGPQNEEYFDAFNGLNYPTNFNGQTKILTAEASVIPNTQYNIKLVIADEGNYRYDSAIFLKGGSFNLGVDFGENRTFANNNPICYDESLTLDATTTGATNYQWKFNNVNIPGATNSTLNFNPPYDPTNQNGTYTVSFEVGNCIPTPSTISLEFAPEINITIPPYQKCDKDATQDGITAFSQDDFDNIKNQLLASLPSGYQIVFFEDDMHSTPIVAPFENSTAYTQTIHAGVQNINCYNFPIELNVNTFDEDFSNVTVKICNNSTTLLDAGSGFTAYSWDTNPIETTQSISINTAGTYKVTLTNTNGCTKIKTFTVINSEIATIEDINIYDFSENNWIEVHYSGNGNYEFSLDGIQYQNSPVFNHLSEGEYTLYIQDKEGCGITSTNFYILDYPKYFTPNGDGYNDTWQIKNLEKRGLENSKIYIFDRYGKLLKQISAQGNGWNGTFNGTNLPASDYWFVLEMPNGKIIKNHFSLKR